MQKNQNFLHRLKFSLSGIRAAYRQERSFRTQCWSAVVAIVVLAVLEARPVWWAIFLFLIAAILACELLNTSLEAFMDRVHNEQHPQIGFAKDCAAGAVLLLSGTSVIVFLIFLYDRLKLL